jgi:hypothetical protein
MEANIVDNFFYNKGTKLDINYPDVADVSETDYTAKKLTRDGEEDNTNGEQRPFIPSHPVSLRMKVETWLGKTITWTFEPGKDPIPLKKIFASPAPLLVQNGETTATEVTTIQVGY